MRKGRFTEEMVTIIREADREPVSAVSRRHGISEQTIYTWRKRFGLHRGIDRDPRQITGSERAARVRDPKAFRQQQLQLVAEPLAPVGQIRALVRKLMLEELFPGEVLEIWIIDPALANAFIGQPVDVLEQQLLVAIERRDLTIDPLPVNFTGKLHQLVFEIDDLIKPRA
jgi:transposase-like protein